MAGALDGIKIVDLTAIISGPMATMMLADQGADVIKVEPPAGDNTRTMGTQRNGLSGIFAGANRNKRSLCIDLKSEDGVAQVLRLVRTADVFIQNFRPGAAERMGLGESVVRAENPDIIYVSIAGFGFEGPYSQRKVYDPLIQAACGMASVQGQSANIGGDSELVRGIVCDKVTALNAAQAITAALFARERGAGGQHVQLNMLDAAIAFQWPDVMWNHSLQGEGITATPDLASMFRISPTSDGSVVMVAGSDAEFEGVCHALNRPDILADPENATMLQRMMHMRELNDWQDGELLKMTSDEACALLDKHQVPCAKVNRPDQLANDPQVRINGSIFLEEHPFGGAILGAAPPTHFSQTPSTVRKPAPALGGHNREVLGEAGTTPKEIDRLVEAGVLRQQP